MSSHSIHTASHPARLPRWRRAPYAVIAAATIAAAGVAVAPARPASEVASPAKGQAGKCQTPAKKVGSGQSVSPYVIWQR